MDEKKEKGVFKTPGGTYRVVTSEGRVVLKDSSLGHDSTVVKKNGEER